MYRLGEREEREREQSRGKAAYRPDRRVEVSATFLDALPRIVPQVRVVAQDKSTPSNGIEAIVVMSARDNDRLVNPSADQLDSGGHDN